MEEHKKYLNYFPTMLNEDSVNYKLKGILVTDLTTRNQADILSDVRSLPGVTIVKASEYVPDEKMYQNKNYYVYLTIKIDPYPFLKGGGMGTKFGQEQIDQLVTDIKKIKGVRVFKPAEKPEKITI
jgi:hypothetical protein